MMKLLSYSSEMSYWRLKKKQIFSQLDKPMIDHLTLILTSFLTKVKTLRINTGLEDFFPLLFPPLIPDSYLLIFVP